MRSILSHWFTSRLKTFLLPRTSHPPSFFSSAHLTLALTQPNSASPVDPQTLTLGESFCRSRPKLFLDIEYREGRAISPSYCVSSLWTTGWRGKTVGKSWNKNVFQLFDFRIHPTAAATRASFNQPVSPKRLPSQARRTKPRKSVLNLPWLCRSLSLSFLCQNETVKSELKPSVDISLRRLRFLMKKSSFHPCISFFLRQPTSRSSSSPTWRSTPRSRSSGRRSGSASSGRGFPERGPPPARSSPTSTRTASAPKVRVIMLIRREAVSVTNVRVPVLMLLAGRWNCFYFLVSYSAHCLGFFWKVS